MRMPQTSTVSSGPQNLGLEFDSKKMSYNAPFAFPWRRMIRLAEVETPSSSHGTSPALGNLEGRITQRRRLGGFVAASRRQSASVLCIKMNTTTQEVSHMTVDEIRRLAAA